MKSFFISLCILCFIFGSCNTSTRNDPSENDLEGIKKRGYLIVALPFYLPGFSAVDISSNQLRGFAPDLARLIAKRIFHDETKIKFIPSVPNLYLTILTKNEADLIVGTMTITPERSKSISFSIPYFITGQSILVSKDSSIEQVQDLNYKKVAVIKGSTSLGFISTKAPHAKPLYLDDFAGTLTAIRQGVIDAFISDKIIQQILIKNSENPGDFKIVGENITQDYYGIGMNMNQPELLAFVNQALTEIINSGEWADLYKKHLAPITGLSPSKPTELND